MGELKCVNIFVMSLMYLVSLSVLPLVFRIALARKNFNLRYDTNIPRQVVNGREEWMEREGEGVGEEEGEGEGGWEVESES